MKKKGFIFIIFWLALGLTACQSDETSQENQGTQETQTEQTQAETPSVKGDLTFQTDTENSRLIWIGEKMIGKHEGTVKIKEGTVYTTDGKITGGNFTIDLNTIENTDQEGEDKQKLEKHLKSEDFFYVEKYPEATFIIKNVKEQDGKTIVVGELTMRGKTNPVEIPAEVTISPEKFEAKAEFSVDRQKWGITYKGMKDNMIKDEVKFKLHLVATPQQEATPVEAQ